MYIIKNIIITPTTLTTTTIKTLQTMQDIYSKELLIETKHCGKNILTEITVHPRVKLLPSSVHASDHQ
jgi:hypothetical protein